MKTPLVSVVMPVWNGEKYVAEAVDSILAQTFREFELIVVDDGSTDGTLDTLSRYSHDRRLRVLRLDHGGIVHALNLGIAEAKSDWIARMDCDDIAHPQRFEQQWRAVSSHPYAVLCYTNIESIGDPAYLPPKKQHFPRSEPMLKIRFCMHCPITHPSVLMRKEAFFAAGGYKPEERHAEDYALWERMLPLGLFIGIANPLLTFRVHGESISKVAADTQMSLTRVIRQRFLRQVFSTDWEEGERLLEGINRSSCGRFSLADAAFLFRLLRTHRLLNIETAAWLAINAVRTFA